MAVKGQRFQVDLSSEDEDVEEGSSSPRANVPAPFDFVADIKERDPASKAAAAPAPPTLKGSATGFPAHRKRTRESRFKQQRQATRGEDQQSSPAETSSPKPAPSRSDPTFSSEQRERQEIDHENRQRMAEMSEDEIEREREELLAGLDPSLVQRLLRRANIDERHDDERSPPTPAAPQVPPAPPEPPEPEAAPQTLPSPPFTSTNIARNPDDSPTSPPSDLHPASTRHLPPGPKMHFPAPPEAPDLDPSSPDFLSSLHTKYFPTLAADPSKLAWMAAPTTDQPSDGTAEGQSPYNPTQETVLPSAIRFSFTGALIPPRTASTIPSHLGLHHHGDAPEAAGYTIPELARLARSAYPAQRCLAYQTLGRVLYRLGRGEFGEEGDDLCMGMWRCMDDGGVVKTLTDEAAGKEGHVSAKAHAVEAVWNWQRGGGRKFKAQ
ncbi:MAG: hypothetical protein M4579_007224 [Chaenotheca gracillima]|nr:MAG: hypothetical protein M4579_007224 [Chaenotheca gracillima]